jgi:hypothetical protein
LKTYWIVDLKECSACSAQIRVGWPVVALPCGHVYHDNMSCNSILKWVRDTNSCPKCKKLVVPELAAPPFSVVGNKRRRETGRRPSQA